MTPFKVGVPSGVGDVYWCLTKLRSFKEKRGIGHLELCVQETALPRAHWLEMVDSIDSTSFHKFRSSEAEKTGFVEPAGDLDCIMWPNAIIDQGIRIEEWLPEYETDLSFPVKTDPYWGDRPIVIYASSTEVNARWLHGFQKWPELVESLTEITGIKPAVIGSRWDKEYASQLEWDVEDMIGITTLPQVASLIERARIVIGVISGMTILANHFRTPCVALYPDKFHRDMPRAWVAPDTPYAPIPASCIPEPISLAAVAASMMTAELERGKSMELCRTY